MCCLENLRHFSDLSVISRLGSEGPTVQWNSLYHHKIEIRNKIAFSLYSSFFSIRYIPKVKSPVSTCFFFSNGQFYQFFIDIFNFGSNVSRRPQFLALSVIFAATHGKRTKSTIFYNVQTWPVGISQKLDPPLHFSDIIYRYNLWRSMIKIVHPRRLGLRIAENRRLCSFPVCCGSNLRIKKILIIARNESLLHTMYIISNRSEEIDEELVRKLSVWKKRSLNRRLAFGYTGQREKKMNIEKRIFYYEFAMLWTETWNLNHLGPDGTSCVVRNTDVNHTVSY